MPTVKRRTRTRIATQGFISEAVRHHSAALKVLASVPVQLVHLGWIAADEIREIAQLLFRRVAKIAAAIMRMDKRPEHNLIGAACEQGLLKHSPDERHSTGMVVSCE
jgi:hypothetical protein